MKCIGKVTESVSSRCCCSLSHRDFFLNLCLSLHTLECCFYCCLKEMLGKDFYYQNNQDPFPLSLKRYKHKMLSAGKSREMSCY